MNTFRKLFQRSAIQREIDEELRFHIEQRTAENIAVGMTQVDAAREARKRFGNVQSVREECREKRGASFGADTLRDLRFAMRQLLKNPGFTAVAMLTLALGIGANTAIFSVVYGVLLKPLPFRDPDQLIRVFESSESAPKFPMSAGDFQDYRAQNNTLAGLALYTRNDLEMTKDGRPELVAALRVSSGYFDVLGVRPMLGRDFRREDESPDDHHVAILSNRLWQRRFNGDTEVVGQKIVLAGEVFTVVGVMPPGLQHIGGDYRSMPYGETVELWFPLCFVPNDDRSSHYLNAVGRLKRGIRPEQAAAEFNVIAQRLAKQFPDTNGSFHIAIQPLHEEIVGRTRTTLLVLFGAVLSVLLIACVNVANLLMARSAARQREMAVRSAVGAGRWRIVRQLLTESLLLAGVGCAVGIVLAKCGLVALARFGPEQLPRLHTIHLDGNVLLFTLALAMLTGLLFGLSPALQASRADLNSALKKGSRAGIGGRQWHLRDTLVTTEVALALVLLVGTGLLVRSFWKLQQTDRGFDPDRVLTATVSLPFASYTNETNIVRFDQQLIARIIALPGVKSAGLTSDLPWSGYDENSWFNIEGKTFPQGSGPGGRYHFVSPDYFRTVGIPLVAGRFFNDSDRLDSPKVVMVNRSLAKRYWPGENPVGQRITFTSEPKNTDWRKVVGVVGDVKDHPESESAEPAFYFSTTQSPIRQVTLAVRSTGAPSELTAAVRNTIHDLDHDVPMANVKTLGTVASAAVAGRRFTFWLVGCFALMALGLAAIGIYGVLSYLVSQRTREIGVRMALGAQFRDIISLTIGQGMRPVLVGVTMGLAGALLLTRFMGSLLYEVSVRDAQTFIACAALLFLFALPSCWLPARRAAKVDPMEALRQE